VKLSNNLKIQWQQRLLAISLQKCTTHLPSCTSMVVFQFHLGKLISLFCSPICYGKIALADVLINYEPDILPVTQQSEHERHKNINKKLCRCRGM